MTLPSRLRHRQRRRSAVARLCLLLASGWVPVTLHAQDVDVLAASVSRALVEERLVGVTWSLVTPGGVTVGAAGVKNRARNALMAPDTRVQVGSVAKTLIAAGVLRLVTEGRISLDTPVADYLPDLPVENPWQLSAPMRVRHLLDQTSGLHDVRLWQVFTMRGDPDAPLRSGFAHEGDSVRLRSPPGARFSYSNSGFLVAAMLIEHVTGVRYETWLSQQLLAPLGMTRSSFAFISQEGAGADTSMAMGYFDGVIPAPSYAIPVRPSSQFATTAADMAIFARFLMGDGVVNGRLLIDSTLLRAMAVPRTTEAAQAGLHVGYALGLQRRERWGITGNCHLGNIGTFRSILCLYPDQQRAFFASFNTDPEGANFNRLDSLIAAALAVVPTSAVPSRALTINPSQWDGWYVARPNRFPQFTYLDELAGVARAVWHNGTLTVSPMQGRQLRLQPLGGAHFRLDGRRGATHLLTRTTTGQWIITDGMRTYERIDKAPVVLLWLSAFAGVLGLLYILLVGGIRAVLAFRRGSWRAEPLRWSTAAIALLIAAPLLYLTQPFLAIGDPTVANLSVATTTAVLPVALMVSLIERIRRRAAAGSRTADLAALSLALQWCVVLSAWNLLPLMLWR